MNKQVLYVSLVSGFLGLLSVILGFTAEVTKINVTELTEVYIGDVYVCYHPSSPAFGTAIAAVLLLVLAQILITAFGGCCGRCKKDPTAPVVLGTKGKLALVFVVISRITFAISVILFSLGADSNGTGNRTTSLDNCYVLKPGIFAGAAISALFTMTFSITSYILLNPSIDAASKPTGMQYAYGIAMGTPQLPHIQRQYPHPGMGGTLYPEPGVGGTQYPDPGIGGTQYPEPGVGGTKYPAPGVGRTEYPPPGTN